MKNYQVYKTCMAVPIPFHYKYWKTNKIVMMMMMMMINKICQFYATPFHIYKKLLLTLKRKQQISVELHTSRRSQSCLGHSPSCTTLHKYKCMKVTHLSLNIWYEIFFQMCTNFPYIIISLRSYSLITKFLHPIYLTVHLSGFCIV